MKRQIPLSKRRLVSSRDACENVDRREDDSRLVANVKAPAEFRLFCFEFRRRELVAENFILNHRVGDCEIYSS